MRRFHVLPGDINTGYARIIGDELQYLARVLRLSAGDPVIVFDGQGREYTGTIETIDKTEALVKLHPAPHFPGLSSESPLEIWLAQGLPKGDKMELVIQKATELGVRGIVPLETARAVVKLAGDKKAHRQVRWQKVACEAAKQCRRTLIPEVLPLRTVQEFLRELPPERLLLIPWEEGGQPLKNTLCAFEGFFRAAKPVYVMIGPEGGWTEEEVNLARQAGGIAVTMGPRILRTETAGLAMLAAIMYQWGDLG